MVTVCQFQTLLIQGRRHTEKSHWHRLSCSLQYQPTWLKLTRFSVPMYVAAATAGTLMASGVRPTLHKLCMPRSGWPTLPVSSPRYMCIHQTVFQVSQQSSHDRLAAAPSCKHTRLPSYLPLPRISRNLTNRVVIVMSKVAAV